MRGEAAWLEVWIDSAGTEYVLLLRQRPGRPVELVDPQRAREVVATFQNYEEARHWLNEDEYELVRSRMIVGGSESAS